MLRSPPWLGWPLWNICVTNDHRYVPLVVITSRSFPHSWLITGFVTRLTRRVPLEEQELPTLPEHLSSSPVFSVVRVTRSLILCVCPVDRYLSFCPFSFGHCVDCSSIYGFRLPHLVSSNSSYDVTDVIPNYSGFFFQPTIKWKWKKNGRRQCRPSCWKSFCIDSHWMVDKKPLKSSLVPMYIYICKCTLTVQCCLHATVLLAVKYSAKLNNFFSF